MTHLPPLTWRKFPAAVLAKDPSMFAKWNNLNAQRLNLPILCAEAMTQALTVFGKGTEYLLVAEHQGAVAAMMVLVPVGIGRWQTFQPSQLPLGAWVAVPEIDLAALCASAMQRGLGLCLVLSVTQVDPLQAARTVDNAQTRHIEYIDTAWIDIEGDFDTYWNARGKNLRQNIRKQHNKLATDGVTTVMRVLCEPEQMAPAIARYGAMESAGWKGEIGTAIHPDNDQGRFYIQLLADAAGRGEARIFEYLFGDQTVAMNLCLLRGGTLLVLKTTYDERIPSALSPASLLREAELRYIFGSPDIRRIEYYGRVMDWHTKWSSMQRTLYHLTTYRLALLKRLADRSRAKSVTAAPATLAQSGSR